MTGCQPAHDGATDSRLVQRAVRRAQAGDGDGLHFLYMRFAPDVRRYVASFVHDPHEAEDIAQTVFAKLTTAIRKYEQRETPFAAWILRVARNAALDHLRGRRAVPTAEVRLAPDDSSQTAIERRRDLRQALRRLPDDQREVVVMRHFLGLSPAEIARRLDKSESSVHGLHHRGRRTLTITLTSLGAAPQVVSA